MKITPSIIAAIHRAINFYGNVSQLATVMGVAHSTIHFWIKGKTTDMSGKLWLRKIRPVLAPFLSKDQLQKVGLASYPLLPHSSGEFLRLQENPPPYVPGPPDGYESLSSPLFTRKRVPLVPFISLSKLDPTVDPIPHFLRENRTGKIFFSQEIRNGTFGIHMEHEYEGLFLPGTDLLVSTEDYPENGDFAVARIRKTGDVVIRRYQREGSRISLISPVKGEQDYSWDCVESPGFLIWGYPVLEALLNFRQDPASQPETFQHSEFFPHPEFFQRPEPPVYMEPARKTPKIQKVAKPPKGKETTKAAKKKKD